MTIESEVKIAVNMLHTIIEGNYVNPYDIVEMMSPELRDWLGSAKYAHSANMDAITKGLDELQALTEEDYNGDLILDHLTSYKERMDNGEVSKEEAVQSLQRAGIMDEHGKVKNLVGE